MVVSQIKSIYSRNKTLISNFNFISVLQISQVAFPLIIYPYLIRVLGKETYGIIAYSNAIVAYLLIIINFGFNISEIKDISVNRENIDKVSDIVSSVFIIRAFLLFLAIGILLILIVFVPAFSGYKWLYLAYLGLMINGAFDPAFYFQGIEKMKFITIVSILANVSFLILMFLFINDKSQFILVPLFTSLGAMIGSIAGLYILFARHRIRFSFQSLEKLKFRFKESFPFFSSRISVIVIDKSNVILIGLFNGYTQVAYYDLAAKLVGALKIPFGIFNQILFPNVSRSQNVSLVINILKILILFYVVAYFSLFFIGEILIKILGGISLLPSKYILYLLGITIVTELISTFLGAPTLLAKGHKNEYNRSIIYGSIFYGIVVFGLYVTNLIGIYQLTITTVCSGTFILLYRYYYCKLFKII
jgi:PST family polysaccharide transporter